MTEAKHTPGPWQVGSSSGHNACHVYDGADDSICTLYGIYAHQSVEQVEHDKRCAEGMANARLIAAAPDMLEALKAARTLLTALNGGHPHDRASNTMADELALAIFDAVDAAIAKATGA